MRQSSWMLGLVLHGDPLAAALAPRRGLLIAHSDRERTLRAMASWAERQLVNRAVRLGVRLGRDIDGLQELELQGRRSGKTRRIPMKVLELDGERYVVSLGGSSGWVCNLRARRSARLRFGRRVECVVAVELDDGDKLPILQAYLAGVTRPDTRRRLEWATAGLPDAEAQRQAARFPVFRLDSSGDDG